MKSGSVKEYRAAEIQQISNSERIQNNPVYSHSIPTYEPIVYTSHPKAHTALWGVTN
jgi:hypothetical protein